MYKKLKKLKKLKKEVEFKFLEKQYKELENKIKNQIQIKKEKYEKEKLEKFKTNQKKTD